MNNFTGALRAGVAIAVTTSSAATALDADPNVAAAAGAALVDNRGAADVYVRFGASDATVTAAAGLRVPAGQRVVLGKGSATHIALIGAAASNVVVHLGEGL